MWDHDYFRRRIHPEPALRRNPGAVGALPGAEHRGSSSSANEIRSASLWGSPRFDSGRPTYGPTDQRIIRTLADIRFALGFFYQSAANHLLSSVSVNVPFGTQKMLWFLAALWVRPKETCWHGGCVIPRADSKRKEGENNASKNYSLGIVSDLFARWIYGLQHGSRHGARYRAWRRKNSGRRGCGKTANVGTAVARNRARYG